jgi:hypothetical protein
MLLLLASLLPAMAMEPVFEGAVGVSFFGLGQLTSLQPGLKQPLWVKPDSLLFSDPHLTLTGAAHITPAYARVGPELTFSPIAVMKLGAHAYASPYFGTFSSLIPFDSPLDVADGEALDAKIEAGERVSGMAWMWGGDATLQAKAGPVVLAAVGSYERWDFRPGEGFDGAYTFEPQSTLLLALKDSSWGLKGLSCYEWKYGDGEKDTAYFCGLYNQDGAVETGDRVQRVGPLVNLNTHDGHWNWLLLTQGYIESRTWPTFFPPYIGMRMKYTWKP